MQNKDEDFPTQSKILFFYPQQYLLLLKKTVTRRVIKVLTLQGNLQNSQ